MWICVQGKCKAEEAQAGSHRGQSLEVQLLSSSILSEAQPEDAWENTHAHILILDKLRSTFYKTYAL